MDAISVGRKQLKLDSLIVMVEEGDLLLWSTIRPILLSRSLLVPAVAAIWWISKMLRAMPPVSPALRGFRKGKIALSAMGSVRRTKEVTLHLEASGVPSGSTYQGAEASRPLMSVGCVCHQGIVCIFGEKESRHPRQSGRCISPVRSSGRAVRHEVQSKSFSARCFQ